MARERNPPADPETPDWDRTLRLFQAGSPEFVDADPAASRTPRRSRRSRRRGTPTPASRPGGFSSRTSNEPLNSPRHEPLVKRLFKFADNAGDDAVMAHFLVALDRTIRRRRGRSATLQLPDARVSSSTRRSSMPPDTTLPRDDRLLLAAVVRAEPRAVRRGEVPVLGADAALPPPPRVAVLPQTRQASNPDRYVPAVCTALKLYTDADMPDGLALLDNWGLVHILFHHSPTIDATPTRVARRAGRAAVATPARPDVPQALAAKRGADLRSARECEVPAGVAVGR